MIQILNIDDVSVVSSSNFLRTRELLSPTNREGLYVNIDEVEPGGYSAKHHLHTLQDEFFLVLQGQGLARINNELHPVVAGDFFAKPAGSVPHQFFNNGTVTLKILDCGIARQGDSIVYADDQVVWLKSLGMAFKLSDALRVWSSIPNK
ncbi:MAG: cupin domain-containing protein [Sulfobacillus sp.]|nr:cupin domain-containing protein [Sulfobacillus sp.]